MELLGIRGLRLRRALLGILLDGDRPMTVTEIVAELHRHGVTSLPHLAKPTHMVIADRLAYQVRVGRVRRVERATYEVVPSSMSRSTIRRCRHWREQIS